MQVIDGGNNGQEKQPEHNQLKVTPSVAYIWEQDGAKTAVIVAALSGSRGQYAKVFDLNTGAVFESVETKYLKPMTFLPYPLGLYAGHDVTQVRELATFLLANFGDQLQTGKHPCEEAKRMLGDVPNHLLGAFYDFMGYLTTCEPSIQMGADADATLIHDAFEKWIEGRRIDPDKYTANVEHWQDNIARGIATQEVVGNANVVAEIVQGLVDLSNSQDVRVDGADRLKTLAYRLGKTIGMEV